MRRKHNKNRNPRIAGPNPHKMRQAIKLAESFTEMPARKVQALRIPDLPKVGVAIGKVLGIIYEVDATGERFRHEFRSVKSRPTLVVSADGKQLVLVRGHYTFTDRGIVDK